MLWIENVNTKLITMMPTSHCRSRPSWRYKHQARGEQAEDRARGADLGRLSLTERVDRGRTAEAGEQVHRGEPPRAEQPLQRRSDDREGQHVRGDVQHAHVQERGGEQPVVAVVLVNRGRHQLPVPEQLVRTRPPTGLTNPLPPIASR